MKIILALSFLTSMSAFAATCPDISGDYICQKGSHISYKNIHRTDKGFIVISDGVEMEYITDKKTYSIPDTESVRDGKVSSYCEKDKLVVDFTGVILYDGSDLAKQVSKTEYTVKGEGMIFSQKIKMKGLPLPALTLDCKKQ